MNPQLYLPPDPWDPREQQRIKSGRPSSRLEVQQYRLDHIRQRNSEMSIGNQPGRDLRISMGWLLKPIDGGRRLIGRLLMTAGQRVYPGAA